MFDEPIQYRVAPPMTILPYQPSHPFQSIGMSAKRAFWLKLEMFAQIIVVGRIHSYSHTRVHTSTLTSTFRAHSLCLMWSCFKYALHMRKCTQNIYFSTKLIQSMNEIDKLHSKHHKCICRMYISYMRNVNGSLPNGIFANALSDFIVILRALKLYIWCWILNKLIELPSKWDCKSIKIHFLRKKSA